MVQLGLSAPAVPFSECFREVIEVKIKTGAAFDTTMFSEHLDSSFGCFGSYGEVS